MSNKDNIIELNDEELALIDDCLDHCKESAITTTEYSRISKVKKKLLSEWTKNE